ncbi:MAG: AAA family ATPase [Arcicella sp.]|nr:AAA family ATPase [Arcicella sp.]
MENFRIESLEINKIGAFEHLKMDFPKKKDPEKAEIHILTGENGTGKSTILECFVESIMPLIQDRHTSFHKKSHYLQGIFGVKFENYPPSQFIYHGGYFLPTSSTPVFIGDYQNTYSPFYLGTTKTPLTELKVAFFAYSGYRRISEVQIIGPKQILDNPLKDSLDFNKSINPENLMQWIVNTITAELNSKGRGDSEKARLFKKSLKKLEEILCEITSKRISFDIDDNWNVKLKEEFDLLFDVLPDGLKSMISWRRLFNENG